jgi:hypothetical protein
MVKCGTCSLQEYYRKKFPDYECLRVETVWREDAFEQWEELLKENPKAIPVIITRNIEAAAWSYFWYFRDRPKDMKFGDFLEMEIDNHYHGKLKNILEGYNFPKWIEKWRPYNPLVVSLEEMKKLPDFECVNKSADYPIHKRKRWGWKNDEWPEMNEEDKMKVSLFQ